MQNHPRLSFWRNLSGRYQEWNAAIASEFLGNQYSGRRVLLYVDEEKVKLIAESMHKRMQDPVEDFCAAIIENLDINDTNIFNRFIWPTRLWNDYIDAGRIERDTAPPFLALLALLVLAATRMDRSETLGVNDANYYVRLRQILGLSVSESGQPGGFGQISDLFWPMLEQWLKRDNRGRLGLMPDRYSERRRFVSRPINQCVIRNVDRNRFPDFFRWSRLRSGEELPGDEELIRWLRVWGRFTQHGDDQLGDLEASRVICDVIRDDFEDWNDAEVAETVPGLEIPTRRRTGRIVLQFEPLRNGTASWAFVPEAGFVPHSVSVESNYGRLSLGRRVGQRWLQPLDISVSTILEDGNDLEIRDSDAGLKWSSEDVIVLSADRDQELFGHISSFRIVLGSEASILCKNNARDAVRTIVEQCAASGWFEASAALLPAQGWALFRNVRFVRHYAGREEVPECLRAVSRFQLRLEGGLKLREDTWLEGFGPQLTIVTEPDAQLPFIVRVNGEEITVRNTISQLEMDDKLRVGPNEIIVHQRSRVIYIENLQLGADNDDWSFAFKCSLVLHQPRPIMTFEVVDIKNINRLSKDIYICGARIYNEQYIREFIRRDSGVTLPTRRNRSVVSAVISLPDVPVRDFVVLGSHPGEIMRVLVGRVNGLFRDGRSQYRAMPGAAYEIAFTPQLMWWQSADNIEIVKLQQVVELPLKIATLEEMRTNWLVEYWARTCVLLPREVRHRIPESLAYVATGRHLINTWSPLACV